MPKTKKGEVPKAEREAALVAELEKKTQEITELVGRVSMLRSEATLFRTTQTATKVYNEETLMVGAVYMVPTKEAFEIRLADELYRRLSATVTEWGEWAHKQLGRDEKVPF